MGGNRISMKKKTPAPAKAKKLHQPAEPASITPIAEHHERKIAEAKAAKRGDGDNRISANICSICRGSGLLVGDPPVRSIQCPACRGKWPSGKWPSYLKDAIEVRSCRRCGAWKGRSCIDPRTVAVFVTVNFGDGPREFCYERVYDYFESRRPVTTEAAEVDR